METVDLSGLTFRSGSHKNSSVIWVDFEYNRLKIEVVKSLSGRWSSSARCWYLPDTGHIRKLFGIETHAIGKGVLSKLSPVNTKELQRMKEMLQMKAYSSSTIKTYIVEFAQLLYLLKDVAVDSLSYDRLRAYILYCINTLKISENQMHSRLNAIKFYFEQVLHRRDFFAEIPRPKKPSSLPKVLSQKEIQRIFKAVKNQKHLLMLQLCYGMGLRVSEVVNLKVRDIDSGRMQVLIEGAKGKKDRYLPLPNAVLDLLREYYKAYRPMSYLFSGQQSDRSYSVRSVQTVFKNAMKRAKVNKPIGIHGLRHSYATHLLEYGTDISFIQRLLGHNDIKTTMLYAKVANTHLNAIKSPLDRMLHLKNI